MRPLRAALVVKPSPGTREREMRNMGWFSYPVPEFTWEHFYLGDGVVVDTRRFSDFDFIYHEDGGNWVTYARPHRVPILYMDIDSTLSDDHYKVRRNQAEKCDLTLVDHDKLNRFPNARPFPYCVNDHVFKPLPKDHDIDYHCGSGARNGAPGGVERSMLRAELNGICQEHGWSYQSGALGLPEYAAAMGKAKIVVNLPRTTRNRPHRVFDALASGACLVTGRLPNVVGDERVPSQHYVEFDRVEELPEILKELFKDDRWVDYAVKGNELVMKHHTWAVRARELRQLLNKEFGL